jgi:TRAP-type C4-dicarboxylate transport system permease large subunit
LAIGLNIFIIVFDVLLLYLARESEFLRWIVYANSVITTLLVMILAIASSTFFYAITYKFFQATNTEFSLKSDVNLFLAMILLTASIISVFCIVDTRKALYLKAGKLTIQQITLKWLCCMAPLEATSTE